jgi:general secretion pathway protein I
MKLNCGAERHHYVGEQSSRMIKASDNFSVRGFTLLEVMVAVAILAIALVAILKANVQSLDALVDSRERTMASLLLASKLAEVEAAGVEDWHELQGDFGEDHPGFSWQVESEPTALDKMIKVIVIVQWGGWNEAEREISVEEFFFTK